MELSKVLTENDIDVKSMNVRTSKKGTATLELGFIVHSKEELNKVIGKLQMLEGVIDIERTVG
jgi:GTP pyrophosphokinase